MDGAAGAVEVAATVVGAEDVLTSELVIAPTSMVVVSMVDEAAGVEDALTAEVVEAADVVDDAVEDVDEDSEVVDDDEVETGCVTTTVCVSV